jgi:hypothetical protein
MHLKYSGLRLELENHGALRKSVVVVQQVARGMRPDLWLSNASKMFKAWCMMEKNKNAAKGLSIWVLPGTRLNAHQCQGSVDVSR